MVRLRGITAAERVSLFVFRSSEAIYSGGAASDEENPGQTAAEMCKSRNQILPQREININPAQDNIKKMLEKADKLGRHGVSTGTIKSFFNAHTDDQYQAAMKQLDGNIILNILDFINY